MPSQHTIAPANQEPQRSYFKMRKIALENSVPKNEHAMEEALKVLREFVLDPKNAALVWLSAKVAHSAAGMTEKECIDCLLHLGKKPTAPNSGAGAAMQGDSDAIDPTKDIYRQLGLQEWVKYLYYGGERKIGTDANGNALYAKDQDVVMHYFGIETSYDTRISVIRDKEGNPVKDQRGTEKTRQKRALRSNYSRSLRSMLDLRNKFAGHTNVTKEEALQLSELMGFYGDLLACLKPLTDTYWVYQRDCQEMMDRLRKEFYTALDVQIYQVADIMNMMYTNLPDKWLDSGKQSQIESLLTRAGMQISGGTVEIAGELNDFVPALEKAWGYYTLCEVSGVEQLKHWLDVQDPDRAKQAKSEDRTAAALAEGSPADWTELAARYQQGVKGVERDMAKAKAWYEKAAMAASPDPEAMYALGQIYERIEPRMALAWYRSAANLGHAKSQVQLGKHCEDGTRKQARNWKEAFAWYEKAANQNDPIGLYNLGRCHFNGRGVQRNYGEAISCFLQAQERGDSDAKAMLAYMQLYGYGMAKNVQVAIKSLQALAEADCAVACYELGVCYYTGTGVQKSQGEGIYYMKRAAKAGYSNAMYWIGLHYEKGWGSVKSKAIARQWYQRAARLGHCAAQVKRAYRSKHGLRWIQEMAAQDYVPAIVKLARWYMDGEKGLKQDRVTAVRMLQETKDRSYEAMWRLAQCYYHGIVVPQDLQQVYTLAETVAKNAKGEDRMMGEELMACLYYSHSEKIRNRSWFHAQWLTSWYNWAKTAAEHGSLYGNLLMAKYYSSRYINEDRKSLGDVTGTENRHYNLAEAGKYLEKAASVGNSNIAGAMGDFYAGKYARVKAQICTYYEEFYFNGNDPANQRDYQRAQYWFTIQMKRHSSEPYSYLNWKRW